jgi:drug/metabolite transporter (DMT)-like permease
MKQFSGNIIVMTNHSEPSALQVSAPIFWTDKAWEGVFWKLLSCACFASINGVVRYLSGGGSLAHEVSLPTNVILFLQNIIGTLLLLPFVKASFRQIKVTQYPKIHLLRVISAVVGVSLWYLTLKKMPLAQGVALSFTGPVFTVMGARLLLGETVGTQRMFAILLSLVGAFIITRPDLAFRGDPAAGGWVIVLPLGSAIALVWNKLLTRKLAHKGESPELLAVYLLLGMAPISLIPALYEWMTPSLSHWPWLLLLGLLAATAHVSFGKAYALAEVTFLTTFGFSKFLFSTIIGYFFFLEIPSRPLWIGMVIIGVSVLLLSYKISLYSMANRFRSSWFKNKE